MAALNYAVEYSRALANAFPYVLNFGALYATPNNNRYRVVDAKTIKIPSISTSGRVNGDRDTIAQAARHYDNAWETKELTNERKWSTLVHPMDVVQTNMVTTIANITKTMNETQKFPEMDAYTVSKILADWKLTRDEEGNLRTPDTTALTKASILGVFDNLMLKMDNERCPANGRILYITHEAYKLLQNAQIDSNNTLGRSIDVTSGPNAIDRRISRLDEVQVVRVPKILMKSAYNFTEGWKPKATADQINMFLVHPTAVITPVSYTFSQLDEPSAGSEGKYIYYEESFEDVFILNKQAGAIQFNITESEVTTETTETTETT